MYYIEMYDNLKIVQRMIFKLSYKYIYLTEPNLAKCYPERQMDTEHQREIAEGRITAEYIFLKSGWEL